MTIRPFALPTEAVASALGADAAAGLSDEEARARLARCGPNQLRRPGRPAYFSIAVRQLLDPLVGLLVLAAAVSLLVGERIEALAIGAIVALNAALGFAEEAGAERAVLDLREGLERRTSVVRAGREREIPSEEIVPGDLVVLREGERVPADARLVRVEGLEVDESILTGESLPAGKGFEPVPSETALAERSSMLFAGTWVTRGRATALVTATGNATEFGRVAELAARSKPPPTPLQRRLGLLARGMVVLGAGVTVVLGAAMLARGASFEQAFLASAAVAVAAVPEGLAATVTVALALGAREMARRGTIVRRLSAIETLGETTVICADKTGTLTENRLRLAEAAPARGRTKRELLAAGVLASRAELVPEAGGVRVAGDPVEGALLLAALEEGLPRSELLDGRTMVGQVPFDPVRRRMAVIYDEGTARRAFVKGAPEVVLDLADTSEEERRRLEETAEAWAADGLRVLAIAERRLPEGADVVEEDVDHGLEPIGLVALRDPLRPAARSSVREARSAGISVRMLTGDHPATARAIARMLELPEDAVFARVTPADKLEIVESLQREGEVVAVTGDGINDAPALRRAHVGVAMGRSGTEAAREAASIVLTDDDFATLIAAVREGRRISDNVRKFIAFLLSANLGEVVLFTVAVAAGLGIPMTIVQVLAVNVLTDGLPAIALSRDPASEDTMARGPHRGGALFSGRLWAALCAAGGLVGLTALGAYLAGRALGGGTAQTMAFATVALAELLFVFSCRSSLRAAWRVPRNPRLVASVLASALALVLAVYLPALREPFGTVPLGGVELGIAFGLATVPATLVEFAKWLARRRP